MSSADARLPIVPALGHRDGPAGIDRGCRAGGFPRHALHAMPADSRLAHSRLAQCRPRPIPSSP